eukprot:m.561213 g.561213  ORF g.561213 m.561213 type:complete len:840 (+) comp57794_c0_seq1:104-2623(+)
MSRKFDQPLPRDDVTLEKRKHMQKWLSGTVPLTDTASRLTPPPSASLNVTTAESELLNRDVAEEAATHTSTTTSTNATSLPSKSEAQPNRGTIILIVGPPTNMDDLDLNYEIVIETNMTNIFEKPSSRVFRKYSHFVWLWRHLRTRVPLPKSIGPLPHSLEAIGVQRRELEVFLKRLTSDPKYVHKNALHEFLQSDTPQEKLDWLVSLDRDRGSSTTASSYTHSASRRVGRRVKYRPQHSGEETSTTDDRSGTSSSSRVLTETGDYLSELALRQALSSAQASHDPPATSAHHPPLTADFLDLSALELSHISSHRPGPGASVGAELEPRDPAASLMDSLAASQQPPSHHSRTQAGVLSYLPTAPASQVTTVPRVPSSPHLAMTSQPHHLPQQMPPLPQQPSQGPLGHPLPTRSLPSPSSTLTLQAHALHPQHTTGVGKAQAQPGVPHVVSPPLIQASPSSQSFMATSASGPPSSRPVSQPASLRSFTHSVDYELMSQNKLSAVQQFEQYGARYAPLLEVESTHAHATAERIPTPRHPQPTHATLQQHPALSEIHNDGPADRWEALAQSNVRYMDRSTAQEDFEQLSAAARRVDQSPAGLDGHQNFEYYSQSTVPRGSSASPYYDPPQVVDNYFHGQRIAVDSRRSDVQPSVYSHPHYSASRYGQASSHQVQVQAPQQHSDHPQAPAKPVAFWIALSPQQQAATEPVPDHARGLAASNSHDSMASVGGARRATQDQEARQAKVTRPQEPSFKGSNAVPGQYATRNYYETELHRHQLAPQQPQQQPQQPPLKSVSRERHAATSTSGWVDLSMSSVNRVRSPQNGQQLDQQGLRFETAEFRSK